MAAKYNPCVKQMKNYSPEKNYLSQVVTRSKIVLLMVNKCFENVIIEYQQNICLTLK